MSQREPTEFPRSSAESGCEPGLGRDSAQQSPEEHRIVDGQSFTIRGVLVGLLVGLLICFSNMYFGLQTGWVSTMTMPASLLGFGFFRAVLRHLKLPFSPVENVLVQTVAGSMAIMPLGCGFVGVIPAMNYLLTPEEQGPVSLSLGKLVLWSLGLCYFGVVFAVPLRRQVIIREQLKFPSGFSTAVLIGVLHNRTTAEALGPGPRNSTPAGFASLAVREPSSALPPRYGQGSGAQEEEAAAAHDQSWRKNVRILILCFFVSGLFTLSAYFFPILRNLPVFGQAAASSWLWTLNPSFAYIGQGIIMGPTTTLHMLLGAVVGWGILSPLAKYRGWAPGDVDDWEDGSKGWIIWTALAIMLADAIVSLGYIACRPALQPFLQLLNHILGIWFNPGNLKNLARRRAGGYASLPHEDGDVDGNGRDGDNNRDGMEDYSQSAPPAQTSVLPGLDDTMLLSGEDDASLSGGPSTEAPDDAPAEQQVSNRVVAVGLVLSVLFCIFCIQVVFGSLVPLYATVTSVLIALLLSIMGVRAMGETDLNPVSGISKLAQLFFALVIPQSNKSAVLINLVAGAVSEAGALQSGDMMQDLKTGHLLGAEPKAQFWGQVIGATVGAVVSAFIYRLYTRVYSLPGDLFPVPTSYVWISTARLVTGKGLPPMAREWAICFAILFAVLTIVRICSTGKWWQALVPGGIAVAVGMYNVPSFTLARTIGGLLGWWWRSFMGWQESPLIVLASGLILGEGSLSIVNLIMQSFGVPHL